MVMVKMAPGSTACSRADSCLGPRDEMAASTETDAAVIQTIFGVLIRSKTGVTMAPTALVI